MKVVENSFGPVKRFSITCGLQEGYDSSSKVHSLKEVVDVIEEHLKMCAVSGKPYLTGIVTAGQAVYAWPKTDSSQSAGSGNEPTAIFSGEKTPLYHSMVTDSEVLEFLTDLAVMLGVILGQTRVYLVYDGNMRILQKEESMTPTGETV